MLDDSLNNNKQLNSFDVLSNRDVIYRLRKNKLNNLIGY